MEALIVKYYSQLAYRCRGLCFAWGLQAEYEDILHDALMAVLERRSSPAIIQAVEDEKNGDGHFYNLLIYKIKNLIIDRCKARRVLGDPIGPYEEVAQDVTPSALDRLSDRDFDRFRDLSSNLRSDDFITRPGQEDYFPISIGYVGGWWHIFSQKKRTYAYWLYSAFWGSRGKGETPHRIKTSTSRHEAYMALTAFNKQRLETI